MDQFAGSGPYREWLARQTDVERTREEAAIAGEERDLLTRIKGVRSRAAPRAEASWAEQDSGTVQAAISGLGAAGGVDFRAELDELAAIVRERAVLNQRRGVLAARGASTPEEAAVQAAADLAAGAEDDAVRQRALAALEVALARQAGANDWWRYFADRIPAGILILFLLATLSAQYRYTMRVAGFYHARADALELAALDLADERVERLANTLAADQGEFKDVKTPADMATELTMEVISKLNLKPVP